MKRAAASALLLALLAASPLRAGDVEFSYDWTVNFFSYETFTWGAGIAETPDPSLQEELRAAVRSRLMERGLREEVDRADLLVFVHADLDERLFITRENSPYGGWPGWEGWATWVVEERGFSWARVPAAVYEGAVEVPVDIGNIPEGMLVVDLVDARANELVWRSVARDVVDAEPSRGRKKIDKAIVKMFRRFPPGNRKAHERREALRGAAEAMALFYADDRPARSHVPLGSLRGTACAPAGSDEGSLTLRAALDNLRYKAAAKSADAIVDIECKTSDAHFLRPIDCVICTGSAARWTAPDAADGP